MRICNVENTLKSVTERAPFNTGRGGRGLKNVGGDLEGWIILGTKDILFIIECQYILGDMHNCQHFHKCTHHMLEGEGVIPDVCL